MKNLIKNTILIALILSFSGCVDLLQEPKSSITPGTMLYDKAKMESLSSGLYQLLRSGNYGYNCRLQIVNLGADDICVGSLNKVRQRRADELNWDATLHNEDTSILYEGFYSLIQGANTMIEGIESSTTEPLNVRTEYIAEARFMRAFAYFNLVRLFGDVPGITDSQSAKDIFGNITMVRNRAEDIYNLIIIPDLKFAEANLTPYGRLDNNSVASANAATICLADVYLTMAGYPLKQTDKYRLAQHTAAKLVGKYELLNNYSDLWKEEKKSSRKEHIFALNHSLQGGMASNYGRSYTSMLESGSSWQDYLGDSIFFENYPADKRRDFNYTSSYMGGFMGKQKVSWRKQISKPEVPTPLPPAIAKYRDFGTRKAITDAPDNGSAQSDGITPIYRYADVLFIYAEAQNRADGAPNDSSYNCVNAIRTRAFRAPSQNTGADQKTVMSDTADGIISKPANGALVRGLDMVAFEKAVFDERGWEFFAEFKRWFELVRTERIAAVNKNPRVVAAGHLNDAKNKLLPLPVREVAMMKWDNNLGYN